MKVIGNGVEVGTSDGRSIRGSCPPRCAPSKRPRIGYAGAIAEWFDFDLVADMARAYPDIPIVLAGPVAPPVRERAALLARDHANVTFIGPVPYETLPRTSSDRSVSDSFRSGWDRPPTS